MFANSMTDMFPSPSFMVFTSTNTVGLEVAAAIKNGIGSTADTDEGLGQGTISVAAPIARGFFEMLRIDTAHDLSPVTLASLSGVG